MNNKQQLTIIDLLSIASFVIGLENLEQNLTQNDKQELLQQFNTKAEKLLSEIHTHLQKQDDKIDYIISRLEKEQ